MNLIENAIKYSSDNTRIHVRTRHESAETVRIDVEDQGCGIPRESIDRVFERFYRVDQARSREMGGTGLGLAIVKHIALVHGGEVRLESTPGKGSTFSILLPSCVRY